jgi:RNA polymerase sigma-70 factor, ECF subfamily
VRPLEQAFRDERAAVLATITRRLSGDLALAEDAVQDAFVAAAVEWDRRGVPDRPGAWLTTTAWRKALDRLRHDRVAAARAADLAHEPVSDDIDFDESALQDDQLCMLFTCCHPALPPEARTALTLRSVAGLAVPEIARAFLSSEEAMERRLTRARRKVTDAAIPFRVPPDELLPERLAGVCA